MAYKLASLIGARRAVALIKQQQTMMNGGWRREKMCIFLVKVHRFYYLLLGALIGSIVFSKVGNVQDMIPTADMNPLILIFLLFGIGFIKIIAMGIFYTEEERKTRDIDPSYGLVMSNSVQYFPD